MFKKTGDHECLKGKDFDRNWEQCRQKVKKLRQDYKQVTDYQKVTGKIQNQHVQI